jgi:tetratricopeptide (TPR) repeat protein
VSRITVCLITKNEERFIGRCLESVRDIADQIVVVDTGSIDWTINIAQRFGAEVYSFTWIDDFSVARNAALERATGDWILMLDADEELLPDQKENLRNLVQDKSAIAWRLPMIDEGHESAGVSYVPRLYRNAPGLFYVGRIHEQIFASLSVRSQEWGLENRFGNATLLHHGYTKELVKSRDKVARNLRLLRLANEEMPGEPNLLMNLGLELVRDGQLDAGLEQYAEALRVLSAKPPAEVVPELRETLLTQFASHLISAKAFREVITILNLPLAQRGGLTASMHFLLGLAYLELKQHREAAEQMRLCLAKRDQPALSPIHVQIRKAAPSHCLAACLAALKQPDAANRAFGDALKEDPTSRPVREGYARFLAEHQQPVEALNLLHQLVIEKSDDPVPWHLGGEIALGQPDFLEVACDWTAEADLNCPGHPSIIEQRARALLLSGQPEQALPYWHRVASPARSAALAGLIISQAAAG